MLLKWSYIYLYQEKIVVYLPSPVKDLHNPHSCNGSLKSIRKARSLVDKILHNVFRGTERSNYLCIRECLTFRSWNGVLAALYKQTLSSGQEETQGLSIILRSHVYGMCRQHRVFSFFFFGSLSVQMGARGCSGPNQAYVFVRFLWYFIRHDW